MNQHRSGGLIKNQRSEDEEEQMRDSDQAAVEAQGIGCLPHDLVIEILSRLPSKTLCKLRCVSKSWHSLLTRDKEFVSRHMVRSKDKPMLLVRRYISDEIWELSNTKVTIELTSIDTQGRVVDKFKELIDGPVHAFISCGPLSILCCMYSLYVCNPSTRQIAPVPYPPNARIYNVGLGYLCKSDEFKIVHLFYVASGNMGCEVFSFKSGNNVSSGSWKRIQDCPFSAYIDEYPLCVNGSIYWALRVDWQEKSILSLDLEREEFSSISYPSHESRSYVLSEYVGLMGALSVVGFSRDDSTMDIWMLKHGKGGSKIWVLNYSIDFPLRPPKFLIHSDDHSEELIIHMEHKDLVGYNLRSGSTRRIGYYDAMKNYNKPCLYSDSLIPLLNHH